MSQTVITKPTAQRVFYTTFARTYHLPAEVTVPDHLKVTLVDGVPKVEVVDNNPHSETHGMTLLYSLQEAADRGIAKFKEARIPQD
jgi:hypothetical protein